MDDQRDRLDAVHGEMMAAYTVAGELLDRCQATGEQVDVDAHIEARGRALRLSSAFDGDASQAILAWRAQWVMS